jgi:hypothetical protein
MVVKFSKLGNELDGRLKSVFDILILFKFVIYLKIPIPLVSKKDAFIHPEKSILVTLRKFLNAFLKVVIELQPEKLILVILFGKAFSLISTRVLQSLKLILVKKLQFLKV